MKNPEMPSSASDLRRIVSKLKKKWVQEISRARDRNVLETASNINAEGTLNWSAALYRENSCAWAHASFLHPPFGLNSNDLLDGDVVPSRPP